MILASDINIHTYLLTYLWLSARGIIGTLSYRFVLSPDYLEKYTFLLLQPAVWNESSWSWFYVKICAKLIFTSPPQ